MNEWKLYQWWTDQRQGVGDSGNRGGEVIAQQKVQIPSRRKRIGYPGKMGCYLRIHALFFQRLSKVRLTD